MLGTILASLSFQGTTQGLGVFRDESAPDLIRQVAEA